MTPAVAPQDEPPTLDPADFEREPLEVIREHAEECPKHRYNLLVEVIGMCRERDAQIAAKDARIAAQARWIEEATQWLRGVVNFHDCVTVTWDIDLKAARRLLAGPGGSQENSDANV